MGNRLYLPPYRYYSKDTFCNWYCNLLLEMNLSEFEVSEKNFIRSYYVDAGFFKSWRSEFFIHHYVYNFIKSAHFILGATHSPTIVDLGCGLGTQSLYFALMGAKVISLDLDEFALSILKKRINIYENVAGRTLDISVHCADALTFDFSRFAPIDAIFSLFAFNLMQPSDQLLKQILPLLNSSSKLAILDGNNMCWRSRLNSKRKLHVTGFRQSAVRSDLLQIYPKERPLAWSPGEFQSFLVEHDFHISNHEGGISLPPILWNLPWKRSLEKFDSVLNKIWFWPVSHLLLAEKS